MTKRRHHVVSKFYLNLFAREKGAAARLHFLDLKTRKSGWAPTTDLCVKRDFNTVGAKGLAPDAIEDAWGKDEAIIAPHVKEIVAERRWVPDAHYSHLLHLMAMLGVRTLHFRREMTSMMTWVGEAMMQSILRTEERFTSVLEAAKAAGEIQGDLSFDDAVRSVSSGEIEIVPDQTHLIVHELKVINTVCRLLDRRHWTFLEATPGFPFVTSDRPVNLMWNDPKMADSPYSPGYGLSGTTVLFPLSPELCLRGQFEGAADSVLLSPIQVAQVNMAMLASCEKQVFSGSEDAIFSNGSSAYSWNQVLHGLPDPRA
jgi:hypothetical protein